MKNKVKFMLIGAVMTGMFSMSQAAENNHITENQIKESITTIIQKQIDSGLFIEHSDINIKIVRESKVNNKIKGRVKKVPKPEVDLTENYSETLGDSCKITLSFDEKGNIPYLGKDKILKNMTLFKNEKQKEMARQFVALHEQSHCEFSSIEDPVQVKGASYKFLDVLNNDLKDFDVNSLRLDGELPNKLSYINTLNESYADVSAMVALIKEYGSDNNDLMYVMKVIETQRQDTYIQSGAEVHNTHMSIKILLKEDNINKIQSLKTQKEFRDFSLAVANDGVQKLFFERPDFFQESFTQENLSFSIFVNMVRIIKENMINDKNEYVSSKWKSNVENGLSYKIAQDQLKYLDYSKYNFDETKKVDGKINIGAYDFVLNKLSKLNTIELGEYKKSYDNFLNDMERFKKMIKENNQGSEIILPAIITKENVAEKVLNLRNKFIEETKSYNMNLIKK